jgi:hypothetical protein
MPSNRDTRSAVRYACAGETSAFSLAFDPRRIAILLIGSDRSGQWEEWYRRMIPLADRLYDEHLETLRQEGEAP